MSRIWLIAFLTLALGVGGGCAKSLRGDVYTRDEARTMQRVEFGTIQSIRPVRIEGTKTPVGAGTGAALGGIAGSTVGDGATRKAATVAGAVAGGLAGAAVEEGVTRTQGLEITIKLDSGRTIAVVQAENPGERFLVGERVRLVTSSQGTTRVAH